MSILDTLTQHCIGGPSQQNKDKEKKRYAQWTRRSKWSLFTGGMIIDAENPSTLPKKVIKPKTKVSQFSQLAK